MTEALAYLEYKEWLGAETLRADLADLATPEALLSQISFRDADVPDPDAGHNRWHWPPPWPGCCTPPGIGSARIWGNFQLTEWVALAPQVFGPGLTARWAAELDAVAAKLQAAGQGSQTMWALDLLHPGQWTRYPGVGFAVQDLVQWGPRLSAELLAEVDAVLAHPTDGADDPWRRSPDADANEPIRYHGESCFATCWWSD